MSEYPSSTGRTLPVECNTLPYEIWHYIFNLLDPFEISRVRQVCKTWNLLSRDFRNVTEGLKEYGYKYSNYYCLFYRHCMHYAAYMGRLDLIKTWADLTFCCFNSVRIYLTFDPPKIANTDEFYRRTHSGIKDMEFKDWMKMIIAAVKGGNVEIVRYCEEKISYHGEINKSGWGEILSAVIESGSIKMLKYAEKKGCFDQAAWHKTLVNAAQKGNLEVFKYSENKTPLYGKDYHVFRLAGMGGSVNILEYLEKKYNDSPAVNWDEAMVGVINGGNFDMVKYCEKKGAVYWPLYANLAAIEGRIDFIRYFESKSKLDWNDMLRNAVYGRQYGVAGYCAGKGADDWAGALEIARSQTNNEEMIKYCQHKLASLE